MIPLWPYLRFGAVLWLMVVGAMWLDSTRTSAKAIADKPATTCRCECPAKETP